MIKLQRNDNRSDRSAAPPRLILHKISNPHALSHYPLHSIQSFNRYNSPKYLLKTISASRNVFFTRVPHMRQKYLKTRESVYTSAKSGFYAMENIDSTNNPTMSILEIDDACLFPQEQHYQLSSYQTWPTPRCKLEWSKSVWKFSQTRTFHQLVTSSILKNG